MEPLDVQHPFHFISLRMPTILRYRVQEFRKFPAKLLIPVLISKENNFKVWNRVISHSYTPWKNDTTIRGLLVPYVFSSILYSQNLLPRLSNSMKF